MERAQRIQQLLSFRLSPDAKEQALKTTTWADVSCQWSPWKNLHHSQVPMINNKAK